MSVFIPSLVVNIIKARGVGGGGDTNKTNDVDTCNIKYLRLTILHFSACTCILLFIEIPKAGLFNKCTCRVYVMCQRHLIRLEPLLVLSELCISVAYRSLGLTELLLWFHAMFTSSLTLARIFRFHLV